MTGRGRGVRAKKIQKPRPLRNQSSTGGNSHDGGDCGGDLKEIMNNIDSFIWNQEKMSRISEVLAKRGPEFEKNCPDDMNALFNTFREAIRSSHVTPMIRCLLLGVLEQRDQKWGQSIDLMEYYEKKKHDLENFNVKALQARKRPIEPKSSPPSQPTQTLQQIQNLNDHVQNHVHDQVTTEDINWEPAVQNLSLQSDASSVSSIENMDVHNGYNSEVGHIGSHRARGRGSRRSSRSSEGSLYRKQDDEDMPVVGRPSSRTSMKSEVDDVFDNVNSAEEKPLAAAPSAEEGHGDARKEAETTLQVAGEVVTISCLNQVLANGVHKLILRYRSALEKFLIDGVLDTNAEQRLYGGQGYYLPKRVRTSSSNGYEPTRDNVCNSRYNYQSRDSNYQSRDSNYQSRDSNYQPRDQNYLSRDQNYQSRDLNYQSRNRNFQSRDSNYESQERSTKRDTLDTASYRDSDDIAIPQYPFSNTPVVAKLSEAIEGYRDKKKEDVTYDAGLDLVAIKEVERASGLVRDNMGYLHSQDVMRQPIIPTSSLAYVAKIQNEQPGGPLSPRERRASFSKTSRKYWCKVKQESLVKDGSAGTIITYPKDFLLFCGSSAIATKPPSFCDWELVMENNKQVCLEKVSNMEIAMRIFNFSTWQPKEFSGLRSSFVRDNNASSHQREYPLSADSTKFSKPNFGGYSRSRSVEESTSSMRPWDIGKSSDPQESMRESSQRNPDWPQPSRRYSGSDVTRQNSWSDTNRQNLWNDSSRQTSSGFGRREFHFNFPSSSVERKEFNFGKSYGTSTNKFSNFDSVSEATSNELGLLLEENTRQDH